MAFWGENWFVGFGGLGLIVAAVLYFSHTGPFQQCVQNGLGAEYCGDAAKSYCRDVSDRLAGRTAACNDVLGEDSAVGSGRDPALDAISTESDPYGKESSYADPSLDGTDIGAGTDDCLDPVTAEYVC
jgi:hypothetical protein